MDHNCLKISSRILLDFPSEFLLEEQPTLTTEKITFTICNFKKDSDGFVTEDKLKLGIIESIEKKIRYLVQEADVDGMGILAIRNFAVSIKLNLP